MSVVQPLEPVAVTRPTPGDARVATRAPGRASRDAPGKVAVPHSRHVRLSTRPDRGRPRHRRTGPHALSDAGFAVESYRDGETGLEAAAEADVDVVVLDAMLPGLDGFEVCRRLRDQRPDALIVMLTARTGEIDRVLGLGAGGGRLRHQAVQPARAAGPRQGAAQAPRRQSRRAGRERDPGARRRSRSTWPGRPSRCTGAIAPDAPRVRPAGAARTPRGRGVHPRGAARPGVGRRVRRLRAHRELAHQPAARRRSRTTPPTRGWC